MHPPAVQFFKEGTEAGKVLEKWWQSLEEARGDRALLRRCATPVEVVFCPAYHRLRRDLNRIGPINDHGLSVIAGLAAHLRDLDVSKPVSAQMAIPRSLGKAPVSDSRFRRLLKVDNRNELFNPLIRIIRLLDGRLNFINLADGIYWWNDSVRRQWAFEYYENAPLNVRE